MKIHDFDAKFYDYARTWMAMHPGLTERQVEDSYNEIMLNFLNAPAKWLDGEKPGEYFLRYSAPKDLFKLLEEYDKRDIGLPEPLYSRVVSVGQPCVAGLMRMVAENNTIAFSESLKFSEITDYTRLREDFNAHYGFINPNTSLEDVSLKFQRSKTRRVRLDMLFITDNGRPDGILQGMVTPVDIL